MKKIILALVFGLLFIATSCVKDIEPVYPVYGIWENTEVQNEYLVLGTRGDYVLCTQDKKTQIISHGQYIFAHGEITFIDIDQNVKTYPASLEGKTLNIIKNGKVTTYIPSNRLDLSWSL